jgi:hypothetical protein
MLNGKIMENPQILSISIIIFNSYVLNYQRVHHQQLMYPGDHHKLRPEFPPPGLSVVLEGGSADHARGQKFQPR